MTEEPLGVPPPATRSLRPFIRDLLVYGSGDAVLRAAAFITLPIYSRLFDPHEFGIWSFLVTFTFLLNAVLALGGEAAYARFFFAEKDPAERQALTSTLLVFVTVSNVVVALAMLPFTGSFSDWAFGTSENATLFVLAFLTAPVLVVNGLLGQVLRNQFRAVLFALLNVATAVLGVALSLYFILDLDWGVKGVLAGALGGALLVLPLRLWTARALLRPVFSGAHLRRVLAFGLPLVPAAFTGWMMSVSDRIVLGKLSTFEEVGLYAVAGSIASVITFLLPPLGQAWSPHAVQAYEDDPHRARWFYGRVLTYLVLGFGFLAVAVSAFADELLALLTGPSYDAADRAIAPLALSAVAAATVQVTAAPVSLRHKTIYIPVVSAFGALFNVALNLLFVPRFGMEASAWATLATAVLLTATYAVLSRPLFEIAYERRRLLGAAVVIAGFGVATLAFPDLDPVVAIPLKAAYCLAFVGALLVVGALDRREIGAVQHVLRGRRPGPVVTSSDA